MSKEPDSSTVNKDENPESEDKKAIDKTTAKGNVQDTENKAMKRWDRRECLTVKKEEIQKLIMRLTQHLYDICISTLNLTPIKCYL